MFNKKYKIKDKSPNTTYKKAYDIIIFIFSEFLEIKFNLNWLILKRKKHNKKYIIETYKYKIHWTNFAH